MGDYLDDMLEDVWLDAYYEREWRDAWLDRSYAPEWVDDELKCGYCNSEVMLMTDKELYNQSFSTTPRYFYVCNRYPQCDAYVGCHPGTKNPLGSLANAELRKYRRLAHSAFDQLWKQHFLTRAAAYAWLRNQLNLITQPHIGSMGIETCQKVIQLSYAYTFTNER